MGMTRRMHAARLCFTFTCTSICTCSGIRAEIAVSPYWEDLMPWPSSLPAHASAPLRWAVRVLFAIDLLATTLAGLTAVLPWFALTDYVCYPCAPTVYHPSLVQVVATWADSRFNGPDALILALLLGSPAALLVALRWRVGLHLHLLLVLLFGGVWFFIFIGLMLTNNARPDIGMTAAFWGLTVAVAMDIALEILDGLCLLVLPPRSPMPLPPSD